MRCGAPLKGTFSRTGVELELDPGGLESGTGVQVKMEACLGGKAEGGETQRWLER